VFFRKLFSRQERWVDHQRTDFRGLDGGKDDAGAGLPAEYERQISLVLRRWGISDNCTSVQVVTMGEASDGRQTFVALVRIFAWDRRPALRLLLGLPLLERKVRKAIRAHWISEASQFGGLWLHASEKLADSAADAELRHLIGSLTHPRPSAWSELRSPPSRPNTSR
jgi:hypothetical protein